ncbi:Cell division cycle-associated 7-like protein [Thalictrum thalictroides]|uniref:Cell division cycle-associated 7-like protein n=1 Tax=Thalictrum thalictroides TaxID=46969 RepID=A0A7J6V936_THATH|nr:Cell division cycle-associated 7-like protein [Thalictrum thalictroides]
MALSPTPDSSSNPILSPQLENLNHNKKKKKYKKKEKRILVESQVENLTDLTQQQQNVSNELSLSSPQVLNQKKKRKYNKKAKKNLDESREKNLLHLVDSTQQQNQNVSPDSSSSSLHHPKKRNNCPGVRVRGGRIFDSENGKTCHQCRQKTRDLVADCKSQRDEKSCTIKFCHKCLRNRYGENAEEANHLADWKCPKCRGVCNCSFCMKKKGHQPTGILVHTAKAIGFGSVLELLAVSGPEKITALREKGSLKLSGEGKKKIKERKRKKLENSNIGDNVFERSNADGTILKKRIKKRHLEIDLNVAASEEDVVEKVDGCEKQLKININKWKRLARVHSGVNVLEGCQDNCVQSENNTEKPCTSSGISLNSTYKEELNIDEVDSGSRKKPKKFHIHKKVASDPIKTQKEIGYRKDPHIVIYDEMSTGRQDETYDENRPFPACDQNGGKDKLEDKQKAITKCKHKNESDVDSSLPQGINLTTVADIELPAEDVLHFLEFCNAFGEELLSKEVPHVLEPAPGVPLEMLASWCNFVHMIS